MSPRTPHPPLPPRTPLKGHHDIRSLTDGAPEHPEREEELRREHRHREDRSVGGRGRVPLTARTLGVREDDPAADDRRLRASHGRPYLSGWQGPRRSAAPQTAGEHGVPVLSALPAYEYRRQHRLWAQTVQDAQARDRETGACSTRARAAVGLRRPQIRAAFRRTGAAHRDGPRP